MDSTFLYALLASIVSSLGGLAGGVLLLANERMARLLSHYLMSFAAGVLLGVTFLDLLPEAVEGFAKTHDALKYVLIGVIVFFLIERAIASFHSHEDEAPEGDGRFSTLQRARPLVILGDSIHNFIDGVVVAVAFLVSVPVGIVTAVSVLLHELPHEIADFTILLRSGMERRRVVLINFFSALVAPTGTVVAYFFASAAERLQPPLLALAAGNLLYIALADLVPHLHHERHGGRVILQIALFVAGATIFFLLPVDH